MQFVVLCSSRGTVFQSVIDRMKDGSLTAKCSGLIADREDRGCVAKAKTAGIPVKIIPMRKGEPRDQYDRRLDSAISDLQLSSETSKPVNQKPVNLVACMGWMWMLSPWFVRQWKHRILNVHPALLPKYPGHEAHDLVLKAKDTESGMTIHVIDEGMDTGTVLLQKKCPVLSGDTTTSLRARVQVLECEWYPKVLQMIETGEMKV